MKRLTVNLSEKYDIFIQRGILATAGDYIKPVLTGEKIVLVSDTNVAPLYAKKLVSQLEKSGYTVYQYIFKAGEESKTTETVINIVEFMAENQLVRGDGVVALGGGVCGDMAGFAAAIYLRGIKFVQVPTSLLAQVDSSVGGKTAVDLPQGKNLCGAFHQPCLVLIDPNTLDTLSPHYFSDGMAEVIKYGCIKSQELFEKLEEVNPMDCIEDIIFQCVDIKRIIVENDAKEHGERALLNFGHTCGHAIEKLWNFHTVSHGEAVGIGMVMIAQAGEKEGITQFGTAQKIISLLEKYNLKTNDTHSTAQIIDAMSADKKRTCNGMNFIMLKKIGESFIKPVLMEDIDRMLGV